MQANPRLGIIGAGELSRALMGHLVTAGIETLVTSASPADTLAARLADMGPLVRARSFEEVICQEIVILALPWAAIGGVLRRVADWEARVLIDATNAIDAAGTQIVEGRSSSERVADLAPGAHVVKAFNTISAAELAQHHGIGMARRVVFYAGDHQRARRQVGRLIAAIGFAGIDLGSLAVGGRFFNRRPAPCMGLAF